MVGHNIHVEIVLGIVGGYKISHHAPTVILNDLGEIKSRYL